MLFMFSLLILDDNGSPSPGHNMALRPLLHLLSARFDEHVPRNLKPCFTEP